MSGNRKQAPKSRHDRGEREKPMAPRQSKPDPDKEIVILQYAESRPSNLSKFKRWIGPICVEKYGVLGTLIESGVLPVIPALAAPDMQVLDPDVDILGLEKARYLGEMKSRQSRVDEIERIPRSPCSHSYGGTCQTNRRRFWHRSNDGMQYNKTTISNSCGQRSARRIKAGEWGSISSANEM